jgi:hypothetical protein
MARHLVQGEFPRFYYGQTYGGGLEVLLAGALQCVLPSGITALRLAAALLALATECLFYRALAPAIPMRTPRLAATAMLALGGMTYARFVAHLYGTHLNNAFIFALLLACLSDLSKLPRRTLLIGLAVGVGYWVSPHVWVFLACILVVRLRQWRELPRISLPCLLLLTLGFALGALPRIIHSYSPESWYAPYHAGGFALLHGVAAIPSRTFELIVRTLPKKTLNWRQSTRPGFSRTCWLPRMPWQREHAIVQFSILVRGPKMRKPIIATMNGCCPRLITVIATRAMLFCWFWGTQILVPVER